MHKMLLGFSALLVAITLVSCTLVMVGWLSGVWVVVNGSLWGIMQLLFGANGMMEGKAE